MSKIGYKGIAQSKQIRKRAIKVAKYVIKEKCTVRQAAKYFGINKTTVHRDLTKVLKDIGEDNLYLSALSILSTNKAERSFRGGQGLAQKRKFLHLK